SAAAAPAAVPAARPADAFPFDLELGPAPPPAAAPPPEGEAAVAARWQALKAQMQRQIRASDWDGAWDTVDDMLAVKPYDREGLEARDYLEKRRTAPKEPPRALATRRLDEEVLRVLRESGCGASLTPDIPAAKLQNAMQSCRVPPGERVLGLIDCTTF